MIITERLLIEAEKIYGHPMNWPKPSRRPPTWWEKIWNGKWREEEFRLADFFGEITQDMRDRFFAEPGQSPYEDAGGAMLRRYRAMLGLPVESLPDALDVLEAVIQAEIDRDMKAEAAARAPQRLPAPLGGFQKTKKSRKPNVSARVKKIVLDHLQVSDAQVVDGAAFGVDLGANSLDQVELVMSFEEEFGIEISDDEMSAIVTVGDAVRYIEKEIGS